MIQFRPFNQEDGLHLRFDGIGLPFRFRLGKGEFRQIKYGENFMFHVVEAAGQYIVQVLYHEYAVSAGSASALDVLGWYLRSEGDYETEHSGVAPIEKEWVKIFQPPTGSPLVTWLRRRLVAPQMTGLNSQPATGYFVHATLLHPPSHILDFVVTGVDPERWTEHGLLTQAVRIADSYAALPASR